MLEPMNKSNKELKETEQAKPTDNLPVVKTTAESSETTPPISPSESKGENLPADQENDPKTTIPEVTKSEPLKDLENTDPIDGSPKVDTAQEEETLVEEPKELTLWEKVLLELNGGRLARREGWPNGKMVFQRPSDTLSVDTMVVFVKLLPQSLKDWLKGNSHPGNNIEFTSYLCLFNRDSVINGWLPSAEDIEATDWIVF